MHLDSGEWMHACNKMCIELLFGLLMRNHVMRGRIISL